MKNVGPDPAMLRESATALLKLAEELETKGQPAIPMSPDPYAHLSTYLLAHLAEEELQMGVRRRGIIDLGSLSDDAFHLLLAIIASADTVPMLNNLARRAGLPVTSCMRLLARLHSEGFVLLDPTPGDDNAIRVSVSRETQGKVAAHLVKALGNLSPKERGTSSA